MRVMHLWQDYSPNLFDKSHPLCLAHGLGSEIVCQSFIENGAEPLPATYFVRKRDPSESNSSAIFTRLVRRLRRPLDTLRFANLTRTRVAAFHPDVLHVHFGTTAAALEKVGALPNVPMIISFYGVDVSESLRDASTLNAYRSIFSKAGVLHVLCDEASNRLVAAGCPSTKIRIANLPANVENFPDIGTEKTSVTRFLIPARFVEKKGHIVLLDAFHRLVDNGIAAQLTCFGYGPSAWLVQAVSERGLNDAVRIMDNRQAGNFTMEYQRVLRQHDVVLAPSIRSRSGDDEGGPALTLVMAQAAGKPVIVSDFPGSERSVADGVQGMVVPSGNVDELYRAMSTLACDRSMWERFGRSGRQRVLGEFSDENYWITLSDWYFQTVSLVS